MSMAVEATEPSNDIAMTVVVTMRQMGVLGLPRNYEIFYEALTGSNHELSVDLVSLGNRPKQEELDRIGHKYFAENHGHGIVEGARETISQSARGSRQDPASTSATTWKNTAASSTRPPRASTAGSMINKDILQKIVGVMSTATNSTIDHGQAGRQLLSATNRRSSKTSNRSSRNTRSLADTDPLTHIWNRRAFDRHISRIYNSRKSVMFNALILADIDSFKEINDRYGHPVGDKIIQIIAEILQSNSRGDMFVARTGGEEFALIVEGGSVEATFNFADRLRAVIAADAIRQQPGPRATTDR